MHFRRLLFLLMTTVAAPVAAQSVTVTPFFGKMIPATPFLTSGNTAYPGLTSGAHTIYGIRVAHPLSPRVGIDVEAGLGNGTVQYYDTNDSRVLFADLRSRWLVAGRDADGATAVNLLVGAGWIQYRNSYLEADKTYGYVKINETPAGIVGAQFRLRRAKLGIFELEVTDRIHKPGLESASYAIPDEDQRLQHDVAFTLGYVLKL